MEFIVASVNDVKFEIEIELEEQYGALPLPFAGMDSKYLFVGILTRKNKNLYLYIHIFFRIDCCCL